MSSTVYAIVFDCQDAGKLAAFWAQALGRTVDADATHDYATIGHDNPEPGQPRLSFIKVPEGKTAKNRIHLDLMSADLDGEVQRLVTLGATQGAKFNEGGGQWITLTDPEGNEFDVAAGEA